MATENRVYNQVRLFRTQRGWSQADIADKAGISRTAVSAIEGGRLSPSVTSAIALARVLDCSVEELFCEPEKISHFCTWGIDPPRETWRYWQAEVNGDMFLLPVECQSPTSGIPHDGIGSLSKEPIPAIAGVQQTLVLACCDPAAGLLANLYQQASGYRLVVVPRSSQRSLELLEQGVVHAAGMHLSSQADPEANAKMVRSVMGDSVKFKLLRVSSWEEGLAVATDVSARSVRSIVRSDLRWIGREPGSGAHQCMQDLAPSPPTPRRTARDHRGVTDAILSGWADVGVCPRLTCEEAGLQFVNLRTEFFELCFRQQFESDPRMQALLRVVRSPEYRRLLADLPGYSVAQAGEVWAAN